MNKLIIGIAMVSSLGACGNIVDALKNATQDAQATPFSSFSNAQPGDLVAMSGKARTASFTQNSTTGMSVGTISSPQAATANVRKTNGDITSLTVSAPGSSASLDLNNSNTTQRSVGSALSAKNLDGSGTLLVLPRDQNAKLANYEAYGAWATNIDGSAGTVGAGSFGTATSSSAMPSGTTASYTGSSVGIVQDPQGKLYASSSDISVTTNFKTATVNSSNTVLAAPGAGSAFSSSNLDFSGSGTVSGNGFSANVTTADNTSGTASGTFYGRSAQEVGGTFSFKNSTGAYVGSFGGKQ